MTDDEKSRDQLLEEVKDLRLQLLEIERAERRRRNLAQKLLTEEILSEAVVESLPGIFYLVDEHFRPVRWNEALEEVTQCSAEEIARGNLLDFFDSRDRRKVKSCVQHAFTNGKSTVEVGLIAKDQSITPFLLSGRGVAVDGQNYLVGLGIDITKRKRLEQAFQDLFFYAPMGIFIVQNRKFRMVNPGFQKITGYGEAELLGKDCLTLATSEFKEQIRQNAIKMLKGKRTSPYEYQFQTKEGEIKWAMESVTTTSFNGKKSTIGYFMDITERRRLEDQLTRAQKMEAIGLLAGGIAHDFNNLLTALLGYGELMKMDLDKKDPHYYYTEEIMKTANRGSNLTQQLLAFSRRQILQPRVISLNALVAGMKRLLRRLIGEDIELVTKIDPDLGAVRADKGQIEQIIMNLSLNARDAMPQGGKLTIETDDVFLDENYEQRHVEVKPGPYVMLAVSDNGLGMDMATQSHIFEPFFTTKQMGQGTGLGLATVYGIVRQSGGYVWVYSEPGQGTTFKIYLPRVEEPLETSEPQPFQVTELKGRETILLVEDDHALREVISRGLKKFGYKILEAANGGEALLTCEKHKSPIPLLLTDVVLPQMSGRELAERLRSLRQDLKVLYMSGYTENAIVSNGILKENVGFIQKPFKVNALVQKIREVLDSRPFGENQ